MLVGTAIAANVLMATLGHLLAFLPGPNPRVIWPTSYRVHRMSAPIGPSPVLVISSNLPFVVHVPFSLLVRAPYLANAQLEWANGPVTMAIARLIMLLASWARSAELSPSPQTRRVGLVPYRVYRAAALGASAHWFLGRRSGPACSLSVYLANAQLGWANLPWVTAMPRLAMFAALGAELAVF